jgi:ketosteroid isomerase-like protein
LKYVQAGDVSSYLTLWHDRFVGWPCLNAHPAAKDSIANWVRTIRDGHIHLTSHLTREGAADFGDIVIVYYSTPMLREYPDGRVAGRDMVWKFTHTWRRDNDRWQIVGGMCGLPVVHAF